MSHPISPSAPLHTGSFLMRMLTVLLLLSLPGTSTAFAEKVVLVAGGGDKDDNVPATQVKFNGPFGVDFDKAGNMYVVEIAGHRVFQIDPQGQLKKIGGTGEKGNGGDNGPALRAQFNGMHNLAVTPQGDIYIADTWNNRVRVIDGKTRHIKAFAGVGGEKAFAGDNGPALQAQFSGIYCIAFDPQFANLYLVDLENRRVRKVDMSTGIVTTVAGNGQRGVPADGAVAKSAPLVDPRAVAADKQGNVYILERGGHALRIVNPEGKIRTVAGTGKAGHSGDGGDALKATLNGPKHLCLDLEGNVLIADTENHVIRKYLPKTGQIVRVAGTGKKGSAGLDGPPDKIELVQPHGVYVHADGTLYITDSWNHRILKIVP